MLYLFKINIGEYKMKVEEELLSLRVEKKLAQEFKKLIKSSGYTQKAVLNEVVREATRMLREKELAKVGGLFNAEKRD